MVDSKNPWKGLHCGRPHCFSCSNPENEGNCRSEGSTYSIRYSGCKEAGIIAEYTGETSRSLFCRGREHYSGLLNEDIDNPLWKHSVLHHNGEKQVFTMALIRKHLTAFSRQMDEEVLINEGERDVCLNSKSEWNGVKIPRLVTKVRNKVNQVDLNGAPITAPTFYKNKRKTPPSKDMPIGHLPTNNSKRTRQSTNQLTSKVMYTEPHIISAESIEDSTICNDKTKKTKINIVQPSSEVQKISKSKLNSLTSTKVKTGCDNLGEKGVQKLQPPKKEDMPFVIKSKRLKKGPKTDKQYTKSNQATANTAMKKLFYRKPEISSSIFKGSTFLELGQLIIAPSKNSFVKTTKHLREPPQFDLKTRMSAKLTGDETRT